MTSTRAFHARHQLQGICPDCKGENLSAFIFCKGCRVRRAAACRVWYEQNRPAVLAMKRRQRRRVSA
jgi:hypothetical protein